MTTLGNGNKFEIANSVDGTLAVWWVNNGMRRSQYCVVVRSTSKIVSRHNTAEIAIARL